MKCDVFDENDIEQDVIEDMKGPLSSHVVLGDVAISQVDFVYLMTQLDSMGILLREDNFKMYSRSSLEKMVLSLKSEFEKYVNNLV